MSFSDVVSIVNKFSDIETFYITGGEPLLHPQIIKILNFLKNNGKVILFTNATKIIDLDYAERLLKCTDEIIISIDNNNKNENNLFRGGFTKFIKGLNFLSKIEAKKLNLKICLHKKNIHNFIEIINFYKKNGINKFSINFIISDIIPSIDNLDKQVLKALFVYIERNKSMFDNYSHIMNLFAIFYKNENISHACRAGQSFAFIDSNCNYFSCPRLQYLDNQYLFPDCFSNVCSTIFEMFPIK